MEVAEVEAVTKEKLGLTSFPVMRIRLPRLVLCGI